MFRIVSETYHDIEKVRPLVRPTYSQLEVDLLPPYGDPEVHLLGEAGTYLLVGLLINEAIERFDG